MTVLPQALTPIDPDGTDTLYGYMDVPSNPHSPTSSTTLTLDIAPNSTRTFSFAVHFAPPAPVGNRTAVLASMEAAVTPYVEVFHATWGSVPQYCPTPSVGFIDTIN